MTQVNNDSLRPQSGLGKLAACKAGFGNAWGRLA
jgi:hypothetical protein